jgi:uncharacterized integral membrane protein
MSTEQNKALIQKFAWPVGNIIVWANLIGGLAASVALGLQLMDKRKRTRII